MKWFKVGKPTKFVPRVWHMNTTYDPLTHMTPLFPIPPNVIICPSCFFWGKCWCFQASGPAEFSLSGAKHWASVYENNIFSGVVAFPCLFSLIECLRSALCAIFYPRAGSTRHLAIKNLCSRLICFFSRRVLHIICCVSQLLAMAVQKLILPHMLHPYGIADPCWGHHPQFSDACASFQAVVFFLISRTYLSNPQKNLARSIVWIPPLNLA